MQMYFLYRAHWKLKNWQILVKKLLAAVTSETMKNVSNTYDKISRGWNDTSHNCFFSQVLDVAKETKFIVSVNEFADEELEARKLRYLCCN